MVTLGTLLTGCVIIIEVACLIEVGCTKIVLEDPTGCYIEGDLSNQVDVSTGSAVILLEGPVENPQLVEFVVSPSLSLLLPSLPPSFPPSLLSTLFHFTKAS